MASNKFQGEITLIKINDGEEGKQGSGILAIYEFYQVSKTISAPEVPSETFSVEQIKQQGYWKTKDMENFNTNINNDTPYLWNFKRTEYTNGMVTHSAAVIASYWATAPQVQARYSADGMKPWEENYDSKRHNYIVFSYDDGITWEPFTSGSNLEDGIGGIRIKGRVEVDDAAVVYRISSSQNEVYRYVKRQENIKNIIFSPDVIQLKAQKEYLNIIENLNLVESFEDELEKPEDTYIPTFQCFLKSSENNNQIEITNKVGEEGWKIDYDLDTIFLNLQNIYNYIKTLTNEGTKEDEDSKIYGILLEAEFQLILKLNLFGLKEINIEEKIIPIRYATTSELASFSLEAGAIVQSVKNSTLTFSQNGLEIRNSGIKIYKPEYKLVNSKPETIGTFLNGNYYKENIENGVFKGYIPVIPSDFNEELPIFVISNTDPVFYVDTFGDLQLKGNGTFNGSIYAEDGYFKGILQSNKGFLENLFVNGKLTVLGERERQTPEGAITETANIILQGLYDRTNDSERVLDKKYYYFNAEQNQMELYTGISFDEAPQLYEKNERSGIYSSNYDSNGLSEGFFLDSATGSIFANSIKLGKKAEIGEYIQFNGSNGTYAYLYNPSARKEGDNVFIAAGSKEEGKNSFLTVTTDGIISIGSNLKHIKINGPSGTIQTSDFVKGSSGWRLDENEAEFNNIIARGTLKSSVLEYNEVTTVGGTMLIRPSAMIVAATLEDGVARLTLESNDIEFNNHRHEEDDSQDFDSFYYFRIGNEKKAYIYVSETEDKNVSKQVVVRKYEGYFNEEEVESFVNQILIGYGRIGDIGIGINSSDSSTAMPPEAISVFETKLKKFDEEYQTVNGNLILEESCRIILGQMDQNKMGEDWNGENIGKYGLFADQVYVKGALVSKDNGLYSGINSNSTIKSKYFKNQAQEGNRVILWAGANIGNGASLEEAVKNAPFQVDEQGNLLAQKGRFEGTISSSEIIASTLKAARIEGYDFEDKPALVITNADKAIEFNNGKIGEELAVFLNLARDKMTVNIPIVFKNGDNSNVKIESSEIYTPNLKIGSSLSFLGNSEVFLKTRHEDSSGVFFAVGKQDAIRMAVLEEGSRTFGNAYFQESIFYGDETMEYRKVEIEQEENETITKKIVGYDLYIKS